MTIAHLGALPPIAECSVVDCPRPIAKRKLCNAHYLRLRRRGTTDAAALATPDRFWLKVTGGDVDSCWLWTGVLNADGYGQFWCDGATRLAHRWAYEALVAVIPDGLTLDHLCLTRRCVNPWHVEPVPRGVNTQRAAARRQRCVNDHPLSGDNLYLAPDGRRACRTCRRAASRRYELTRRSA